MPSFQNRSLRGALCLQCSLPEITRTEHTNHRDAPKQKPCHSRHYREGCSGTLQMAHNMIGTRSGNALPPLSENTIAKVTLKRCRAKRPLVLNATRAKAPRSARVKLRLSRGGDTDPCAHHMLHLTALPGQWMRLRGRRVDSTRGTAGQTCFNRARYVSCTASCTSTSDSTPAAARSMTGEKHTSRSPSSSRGA
jgi:hypothetical protein